MEIIFLGTSSSWAIPYPFCKCPQCISKNKKDIRLRSSIFIKPNILFDTPPDMHFFFQKYDLSKLKYVFLTHSHSDHIFGLKDLFPNYNPLNKNLKIFTKINVFKDLKKIFPSIEKRYFSFKPPENFDFLPVFHSKKINTYGILFEKVKKIAYIPDTRGIPKGLIAKLKNLDLLILDGTGSGKNHLKEEEIISLILEIKPKKAILTHIGHWKMEHKKLERKFKNIAKIAYDGMKIKL